MDENMGGIDKDNYYIDEPLRSWEIWLNRHEYFVWPSIGAISLFFIFWLSR